MANSYFEILECLPAAGRVCSKTATIINIVPAIKKHHDRHHPL
jgi:hypothetical protein